MAVIINSTGSYFQLNGTTYAKIYHPLRSGNVGIAIYNINDTEHQILSENDYDEFVVDGVVYGSQNETITALLDVIYEPFQYNSYTISGSDVLGNGIVSGSSQISYPLISNIPSGIISSSAASTYVLVGTGTGISGSSALIHNGQTLTNQGATYNTKLGYDSVTGVTGMTTTVTSGGTTAIGGSIIYLYNGVGGSHIGSKSTTFAGYTRISFPPVTDGNTYSVTVPQKTGTMALTSDFPSGLVSGSSQLTSSLDPRYLTPTASATVAGIIELFSDTVQSVAGNTVTTTASRTYGIQLNSSGQAVVNVPWTNTTYSEISDANLQSKTGTTSGLISGRRIENWANAKTLVSGSFPSNQITYGTGTGITSNANFTYNGNDLATNGNITSYDAVNDGNPSWSIGSSATERLLINPVYASGTQTLNYVDFKTYTTSATAQRGKMNFSVDETLIYTTNDDGIQLAAGKQILATDSGGTDRTILYLDSSTQDLHLLNNSNGDGGDIVFRTQTGGGTTATFTSGGNVGINDTSPLYQFTTNGGTSFTTAHFYSAEPVSSNFYTNLRFGTTGSPASGKTGGIGYFEKGGDLGNSGVFINNYTDNELTDSVFIKKGGNVGMGTSTPISQLHVVGQNHSSGTSYSTGVLIVEQNNGSRMFIDGNDIDCVSGSTNIPQNLYLQDYSKAAVIIGGRLSVGNGTPSYNLDVSGSGRFTNNLTMDDNAKIGLGTSNGESTLYSNGSNTYLDLASGDFYIRNGTTTRVTISRIGGSITATSFYESSDINLKTNINTISPSFVSYELKENLGVKRYGVIAQEIEVKHPELVTTNEDGLKSVNYTDLLVMKLAEQENKIKRLEELVEELLNR